MATKIIEDHRIGMYVLVCETTGADLGKSFQADAFTRPIAYHDTHCDDCLLAGIDKAIVAGTMTVFDPSTAL